MLFRSTLRERATQHSESTGASASTLNSTIESLEESIQRVEAGLAAARGEELLRADALKAQMRKNEPIVQEYRRACSELSMEKTKRDGVVTSGVCEHCGGRVNPMTVRKLVDGIDRTIGKLERTIKRISLEKQASQEAEIQLQGELRDAEAKRSKLSYDLHELKGRLRESRGHLEELEQGSKDEYDSIIDSLRITNRKLRGAKSRMEYVKFWKSACGPRELRAERVKHLLEEVNTHSINYSGMLSGGGLLAWMEMNEGGGIDIRVRKPDGSFTYEELSAGEQRRADISFTLALRKASMSLNPDGQAVQVLWLDEVFEAMDRSGMWLVLDVLRELEGEIHGPVILITHLEYLNSMVDKRIWVSKDERGRSTAHVAGMQVQEG